MVQCSLKRSLFFFSTLITVYYTHFTNKMIIQPCSGLLIFTVGITVVYNIHQHRDFGIYTWNVFTIFHFLYHIHHFNRCWWNYSWVLLVNNRVLFKKKNCFSLWNYYSRKQKSLFDGKSNYIIYFLVWKVNRVWCVWKGFSWTPVIIAEGRKK